MYKCDSPIQLRFDTGMNSSSNADPGMTALLEQVLTVVGEAAGRVRTQPSLRRDDPDVADKLSREEMGEGDDFHPDDSASDL